MSIFDRLKFPTEDAKKVGNWAFNKLRPPVEDVATIGRALPSVETPFGAVKETGSWALDILREKAYEPTKRYFEPTEDVRLRDIARQLPETGVKGLKFGTEIVQEMARSGGSLGLSLHNIFADIKDPTGKSRITEFKPAEDAPKIERAIHQFVFGKEPVESIETRMIEGEKTAREMGFGKTSLPVSMVGVGAIIALDFTGFGGGRKTVTQMISKMDDVADISKVLRQVGVADDLILPTAKRMKTITNAVEIEKAFGKINLLQKSTRVSQIVEGVPGIPGLKKVGLEPKIPTKITRKEPVLLRERIRAEARGAKLGIEGFKREQKAVKILQDLVAKEISKPKARQRSTIAFIKKIGELNQTVVNEVKKEIGLTKPISKANLEELNKVLVKMKERLAFKVAKGFKPKVVDKVSKPMEIPEDVYKLAREMQPIKTTKVEIVKKSAEGMEKSVSKYIQPISTRLKNISPDLKRAMRKFEYDTKKIVDKDSTLVEGFLKKVKPIKKAGMSADDYIEYDLALKNGDIKKITSLNKKYGIEKEYDKIKIMLDDIYKRANDVGFDVGYRENYFPRIIKDNEGFLEYIMKRDDWSKFDEAIKRKEMDLGRVLETEEKASIVNTLIRGYQNGKITLSKTGAMENRVIDFVDPELNRFYSDSSEALVKYIIQVNDKIEARKFFGKSRLVDKKVDQFNNIDDSIGTYVVDLLAKGKITVKQEKELTSILQARFNEKGTHGIVGTYKNLSYLGVMGSPFNTLTQIGDLGFAIYSGGIRRAAKEAVVSAFGKSKITKEDIFIKRIAAEFSDVSTTSRMVDWTFRKIGLNKVDGIGKEALVNSTVSRMMKQSEKPTTKFMKELTDVFGKETDDVLRDLQRGEITENVKYLAFNKLLDFQPVALSEVPEMYLKAGNGRVFYMLKTWSLKMVDVYRNEAFSLMSKKETFKEGFGNLLKLTGCMIAAEATADELKDMLLQRERPSLKDRTVDNLLKMAMFSRYTVDQASRQGIGSAIALQIAPATAILDNPYKDLINFLKDSDESFKVNEMKSIQNIPIGGKLYYWWFGKASKNKESDKKSGLPKLPKLPKQQGLPELPTLPKF